MLKAVWRKASVMVERPIKKLQQKEFLLQTRANDHALGLKQKYGKLLFEQQVNCPTDI